MKIGFVGAGKVGFTLGKMFVEGSIPVTGYYSRNRESAQNAANFTGTKQYDNIADLVKDSDAIMLTVPDGQIMPVYETMRTLDLKEKQICHCSGAMSATEAFYDVTEQGAYGYSIHPLFPISSKYDTYRELKDVFFCLEGEGPHIATWEKYLKQLGNKTRRIQAKDKVKYHAACAIASNLVCGLLQESVNLLAECGFEGDEPLFALAPLAKSNLEHVLSVGAKCALTGPMERCDTETIAKHVTCLQTEEERKLYCAVSQLVMGMAKEKHPENNYQQIEELLRKGLEG